MSGPPELRLDSAQALQELVRTFESGQAPAGGFGHRAHLAVALAYLDRFGLEAAGERMREGLLRFLRAALGDDAAAAVRYRETITGFWLRLLARALAETDPGQPLHQRIAPLLDRYQDAGLIHRYYSEARLYSDEARERFLDPDLRPLDPLV